MSEDHNVEYASFWSRFRPYGIDPLTCFLLKQKDQYVGVAVTGGNGLSCYLLPEITDNGLLFPSLRNHILPFLFIYQNQEKLHLSLKEDDFTQSYLPISKKLVLLLGFRETRKDEFELHVNNIDFSANRLDFQH